MNASEQQVHSSPCSQSTGSARFGFQRIGHLRGDFRSETQSRRREATEFHKAASRHSLPPQDIVKSFRHSRRSSRAKMLVGEPAIWHRPRFPWQQAACQPCIVRYLQWLRRGFRGILAMRQSDAGFPVGGGQAERGCPWHRIEISGVERRQARLQGRAGSMIFAPASNQHGRVCLGNMLAFLILLVAEEGFDPDTRIMMPDGMPAIQRVSCKPGANLLFGVFQ